eukprot:TRINITY_DN7876_c0_g2_i2.p1 TRINITY_DN7876_c0_g2~~TRINITY_DN7876_c0_g2_i2.p1  ORF type:complete len:2631 (-),score=708.58 TRINITY_DN7876_c0_g2_i2:12-7805(-)
MDKAIIVPLSIQNAVNAKGQKQGSVLEYGLEYHLQGLEEDLLKGPPNEPLFPERSNEWIKKVEAKVQLLLEWLENFKSRFLQYPEAFPIIRRCEKVLENAKSLLESIKIPQQIKNAKNARKQDGSVLQYGLDFHLERMSVELMKGAPLNSTYSEKDNTWINERTNEKNLLIEWLSSFSATFGCYAEAQTIIETCEEMIKNYTTLIDSFKIPLAIKQVKSTGKIGNTDLGNSLPNFISNLKNELSKGLPNDPRFPERDGEWLKKREREFNLLTEWNQQFKALFFSSNKEVESVIDECELLLDNYKKVVGPLQLAWKIKQATLVPKVEGFPHLEYGLDYNLKQMNDLIQNGFPNDPRFPERDHQWLSQITQLHNKIQEYLSNFMAFFSDNIDHPAVVDVIKRCEDALERYNSTVLTVKRSFEIKKFLENKGILENGFDHFLSRFKSELSKGIPNDERFPERNEQWVKSRVTDKNKLIEWLSLFNSHFGLEKEAQPIAKSVEEALQLYTKVVEPLFIPLEIQKAVNARRTDGSVLEYGLEYHCQKFSNALSQGIPNDSKFPEKQFLWIEVQTKDYKLLVEWLEGFKISFGKYENTYATEVIKKCEALLKKYDEVVKATMLQREIFKFKTEKNILEYGFEYHLNQLNSNLDSEIPNDPRFPEKKKKWLNDRKKEYEKLVDWYSNFVMRFGEDTPEAVEVVKLCKQSFEKYKKAVEGLQLEVEIEDFCNSKLVGGTKLTFVLEKLKDALQENVPSFQLEDWINKRESEKKLISEWLIEFTIRYGELPKAKAIINNCEEVLSVYSKKVEPLYIPLAITKAKTARDGSLEYGLEHHLKSLEDLINRGPPNDSRFPERDLQWMQNCEKGRTLLIEWLEQFKSKFTKKTGLYDEAKPVVEACEKVLGLYKTKVLPTKLPIDIKTTCNARGAILPYGLDYHLQSLQKHIDRNTIQDANQQKSFKKDMDLLVEWLESLKASYVEFLSEKPVKDVTDKVESVLAQCKKLYYDSIVAIDIKNFAESRKILEYGFDFHLKSLDRQLDDRTTINLSKVEQEHKKLLLWLNEFKVRFGDYCDRKEVLDIIKLFSAVFMKYHKVVGGPILQNKLNKALENRSIFSYGVKWTLDQYSKTLRELPSSSTTSLRDITVGSLTILETTEKLIEWVELFKSEFGFLSEAKSIISSVEEAILLCKSKLPAIYKQSTQQVGTSKKEEQQDATTSNQPKKEENVITDSKLVEVEYQPKREQVADQSNEEPPLAEDVEVFIEESPQSPPTYAPFPQNFDFSKQITQELEKKEKSLSQTVGKQVLLSIDWTFLNHQNFKSLSPEDQKKFCMSLVFTLLNKLALSDDGFNGVCNDKVGKLIVSQKIGGILVVMDMDNTISNGFDVRINGSSFEVVINFKEYSNNFAGLTPSFKTRVEALLNLPVRRAVEHSQLQIKAISGTLQNILERKNKVLVRIDWNKLLNSSAFVQEKMEVQVDIIKALAQHAKRFLINGGDSLGEVCSSQAVVKKEVFRRISEIVVSYDSNNQQKKVYGVALNGNQLCFELNLNCWKDPKVVAEVGDRIDEVLQTVVLKARELAKSKLKAYESMLERKIGLNCIVEIDWTKWVTHPKFLSHPIKVQSDINEALLNTILNELLNNEGGLCETCMQVPPKSRQILLKKIKKIVAFYNPEDAIDDNRDSKQTPHHYRVWLNYKFCTLYIEGNMSSWNKTSNKIWPELKTKLAPVLVAASHRSDVSQSVLESAVKLSNQIVGKTIPIEVLWESFIDSWKFLNLSSNKIEEIIKKVHSTHILHLVAMFQDVCLHPFGKKAIQDQINSCKILVLTTSEKPTSVKLEDGIWSVIISLDAVTAPKNQWAAWQLRWLLGVAIPIQKDLGEKKMEEYLQRTRSISGANMELEFDWTFIEQKEFLSQDPRKIIEVMQQATNSFPRAVFEGINQVCSHPVGKESVEKSISKVSIRYVPVDSEETLSNSKHSRYDSKMEVKGNSLCVLCSPSTIDSACKSRYKERIEFEYNLIVAISQSNAMEAFNKALQNLRKGCNNDALEIKVTIDNFVFDPVFRNDLPPGDQSDIITALYSTIPTNMVEQIGEIFNYQKVAQIFKEKIGVISIVVDPKNATIGYPSSQQQKYNSDPNLSYSPAQRQVTVSINLDDILKATKYNLWKYGFMDLIDVLVPSACEETDKEHQKNIAAFHKSLTHNFPGGAKCPVTVDWSFSKTPQFVAYHPHDRWTMLKSMNVDAIQNTLLGITGFSLPTGLCEFSDTLQKIHSVMDNVKFIIEDTAPFVSIAGKTMVFAYTLNQLNQRTFTGCHGPLETLLSLRPIKQNAAIQRANEHIAATTAGLSDTPIPVECNWNDFSNSLPTSEYVSIIDRVAKIPAAILMNKAYDFGDAGLSVMLRSSSSLKAQFAQVKKIVLNLDASNSTRKHIGKSRGLNPESFDISLQQNALVVKLNLNAHPDKLAGIGRVVQFLLCPSEALSEEQNEIRRIAQRMRHDEEDRRRREVERANDENKRIQDENRREQENYDRAMKDWNKSVNEKCNYSQCNGGYSKCGVCAGRGHNTNNNHTSTCSSCKGNGKLQWYNEEVSKWTVHAICSSCQEYCTNSYLWVHA